MTWCSVAPFFRVRIQLPIEPTMPSRSTSTTKMKRPPTMICHHEASTPLRKNSAPLTRKAPMNGPMRVPRPPTAVQITPSIENTGPASRKETMPTQAA